MSVIGEENQRGKYEESKKQFQLMMGLIFQFICVFMINVPNRGFIKRLPGLNGPVFMSQFLPVYRYDSLIFSVREGVGGFGNTVEFKL